MFKNYDYIKNTLKRLVVTDQSGASTKYNEFDVRITSDDIGGLYDYDKTSIFLSNLANLKKEDSFR